MNEFYVYVLFRPWNGLPFYVGKGKGRRWLEHERPNRKHPNRHLVNIIKKAKLLGLEIPRIKLRDGLSESDAFAIEVAFIAAIGRGKNGPLVNATDGGEGAAGFTRSATTRAKQSIAMMGNKNSLGAKRSEETRMKLRSKQNSPETRAKMSAAHRGKKLSAAHRRKLSEAKNHRTQKPSPNALRQTEVRSGALKPKRT
jgi:hypothetical protein